MQWPSLLIVKLVTGTVLLIALLLAGSAWLILDEADRLIRNDLTDHLRRQGLRLTESLEATPAGEAMEEWIGQVRDFARRDPVDMRVMLIGPDGKLLADSEETGTAPGNILEQKDVQEALASNDGRGESIRDSKDAEAYMHHVAYRIGSRKSPRAIVRLSLPRITLAQRIQSNPTLMWHVVLLGVLSAIVFAAFVMMLWSGPIRRLTQVARSLSEGDLSAGAPAFGSDELARLAQALNRMRDHHASQLATIDRHRRTLASLLAQLHEGVIVVDWEGRLVLINPAAVRLLGLDAGTEKRSIGQPVTRCIENTTVLRMLSRQADSKGEQEDEARIAIEAGTRSLWVLARVSDILLPRASIEEEETESAGKDEIHGRLLVLTDVTEFQRMLQMKSDFAANASHELRTPLSAIRGAVETLKEMEWCAGSERAQRFVGMIDRHSARLEDLIGDLLDLSRIESSPARFQPSAISLQQVLRELYQRHEQQLDQKQIQWEVDRPVDLDGVMLNDYLIRLILDNLVDNAWKFTPAQGTIAVSCRRHLSRDTCGSILELSVSDTGCGIPKEDQHRVFERFFQVARDRAGKVPGTGLGLSIVRHAVLAMRGTVSLSSESGRGTTVSIRIPQPE